MILIISQINLILQQSFTGSQKSFDEQTNGWLEISEIVNVVKESDGNIKIAEADDMKADDDLDQKVEQDFGTDDDVETKRKQFSNVDRVSSPIRICKGTIYYPNLLPGCSEKFGFGKVR